MASTPYLRKLFWAVPRLMSTPDLDHISTWQYDLPEELIAGRPAPQRDESRLLVVRRTTQTIEHLQIRDLPSLLNEGDRLVCNNTKVLPARLFGCRTTTGGRWEGLFLGQTESGNWILTGQTRGRLQPGESLTIVPATQTSIAAATTTDVLVIDLKHQNPEGTWEAAPRSDQSVLPLLQKFGTLPLPPYIGRKVADAADAERYQTVFAKEAGAIAAPTAGLHFSNDLMAMCGDRGIAKSEVTLHVGIGTFRPVSSERLSEHHMHSEWCRVTSDVAAEIQQTKQQAGNILAIGTTSVRTLEAAAESGTLRSWDGATNLFIRPGYQFQVVDHLLTNFHLPGSTLIVLVAALAGYELTMEAYRIAVENRYRFYSYGDAMLIL